MMGHSLGSPVGSIPDWGTRIPHKTQGVAKSKKKKKKERKQTTKKKKQWFMTSHDGSIFFFAGCSAQLVGHQFLGIKPRPLAVRLWNSNHWNRQGIPRWLYLLWLIWWFSWWSNLGFSSGRVQLVDQLKLSYGTPQFFFMWPLHMTTLSFLIAWQSQGSSLRAQTWKLLGLWES